MNNQSRRGKTRRIFFFAESKRSGFRRVVVHHVKFYWEIKKPRAEKAHHIGKMDIVVP